MKSAETDYNKQSKQVYHLKFNLSNILAFYGKFSELYTFANYAFQSDIPWTDTPDNINDLSILEGSGTLVNEYYLKIMKKNIYKLH